MTSDQGDARLRRVRNSPYWWPTVTFVGWTMVVLAALFIPAMGIVRYLSADQDKFLLYGSAAGGIALLWLLWQAAMGLFAARENAIGGQILLRLLVPGVIAPMVAPKIVL